MVCGPSRYVNYNGFRLVIFDSPPTFFLRQDLPYACCVGSSSFLLREMCLVLFLFRLWVSYGWMDFSGAVARANRVVSECTIRRILRVA
jgi:hypothetical protein